MNTVIAIGSVVTALTAIVVALYKIFKVANKFNSKMDDIDRLKKENVLIIKGLFATCDGLIQLKANGPVTQTRNDLQKYIIEELGK